MVSIQIFRCWKNFLLTELDLRDSFWRMWVYPLTRILLPGKRPIRTSSDIGFGFFSCYLVLKSPNWMKGFFSYGNQLLGTPVKVLGQHVAVQLKNCTIPTSNQIWMFNFLKIQVDFFMHEGWREFTQGISIEPSRDRYLVQVKPKCNISYNKQRSARSY